jgi:hypothetical protein
MPTPVSRTWHRTSWSVASTASDTDPAPVNLTALPHRFTRICRSLSGSVTSGGGTGGTRASNASAFCSASGSTTAATACTTSATSTGAGRTTSRPASSALKVRISSIIAVSWCVTTRMRSTTSACGTVSGPRISSASSSP